MPVISRHKTALRRTALSRPVARALEDGLITPTTSVFDYGCGRGGDIRRLRTLGIDCAGYDPTFFPSEATVPADVVNLGYVINVIENEVEREDVLVRAWDLAATALVVSARLTSEGAKLEGHSRVCSDGVLTGRGTFQKFFGQDELREWITGVLRVDPVAAEPGVFYVFRDPVQAELFALTRVRRRPAIRRRSDVIFEEHGELLTELMEFIAQSGRLPRAGEFSCEEELRGAVGSFRQAFRVIRNVTGDERWDRSRLARYEDLLVYLALARFRRRPRLSQLPRPLQVDLKEFFGSYKAACNQGDRALFAIGEQARVREAIATAAVGKRTPSALYIHVTGVPHLPVALRIMEGVARELLGVPPEATVVKLGRDRPRVAFLEYPDFDEDPHPALRGAYSVSLDSLRLDYHDFSDRANPPILHRKETFVAKDYPLRQRFERLTNQEVRAGLFADPARIGTRRGWEEALASRGLAIRGHQTVRAAPRDC